MISEVTFGYMMIKIAVAAFSLGFLTTTAQAATGEMNQLTSLAVPTFECNLPKFKPSGIATNEIRQLQKIESRYKRCVTRFKNKLGEYKKNLVALKKTVSTSCLTREFTG